MSARAPVYLDYAATTPVDPRVAAAMLECLTSEELFGNPASTTHEFGRAAAARVDAARVSVARLIGAEPADLVFTSGATESDNLALLGLLRANRDRGRHLVTARTEHRAVIDPARQLEREGFAVTWLSPDRDGRVDPQAVRAALRTETLLVSIMHVNNETGVINDIGAIGAICREHNVLLHSDAAQSVGRLAIDLDRLGVDLFAFTAHKLYGPKGIGALWIGERARPWLRPLLYGGGQEQGLRSGTLATHQIAGFGVACELAQGALASEPARLRRQRERLWERLSALGGVLRNGAAAVSVPAILNVSFEGVQGESLIAALGDVAAASGSACTSATQEPSYVLRALGRRPALAQSSLRLSLGRPTTDEEIERAAETVAAAVTRLRQVAPGGDGGAGQAGGATALRTDPASQSRVRLAAASGGFRRPQLDPLSPEVRRLFEDLPGSGALEGSTGRLLMGEAGGEAAEAQVRFQLVIEGDTVKDARFQAWGCPHTLAVCAWIAGQLPGRRRGALAPGRPEEWRARFAVPVEKLGRLLVVEDALRDCEQHWPGSDLR